MNYFDIGLQNSRGFRALKVWIALQHAGAAAYREMIRDDITLARYLYDLATEHPELEAITHNLSITTLRYFPLELRASIGSEQTETYLNRLNQLLLTYLENSGASRSRRCLGIRHQAPRPFTRMSQGMQFRNMKVALSGAVK
jgi:glutamate/tyrosine decarboxylase-like PLP-dependent enzyme